MSNSAAPNLLVIMFEQFCGQVVASDGDMIPVDLPHFSRLHNESICFENAYCNAPVCGPSRLSFLSGRYPHRCEAYDNGSILPSHIPTFGHMLTLAGYHTALCGRMHIHGLDTHRGFEHRLSSEIINPLLCVDADHPAKLLPICTPGPQYHKNGHPSFSDSPIYKHDEYVTDQACQFLIEQGNASTESPFAMLVGYFTAHSGFRACPDLEPLYQKYLKRDLPLESFTHDHFNALPEHAQRLHLLMGNGAEVFDSDYHRREMALYFARLEYADQQLGRVLDALETSGCANDTVVLVTADHGENMGRHGLWGKMNFYEQAQRIPLSIRVSGEQSRTVHQPMSLVDCLPTFADIAGIDVEFPIDGKSVWSLIMSDQSEHVDAEIFSEYHGYLSAGQAYMLRQGSYKYCDYEREEGELYDLNSDPAEIHNLISDPEYASVRDRMKSRLAKYVDRAEVSRMIEEHNC